MSMLPIVQRDVPHYPLRMRDLDQPSNELLDPVLPIDSCLLCLEIYLLERPYVPSHFAFKEVGPADLVLP
jgi:hypothetical protein